MAEQILAYPRDQVRQDTGYNCGPASAQTVIRAATGRLIPEGDLGRRMRTTVNGTDYIGLITPVLNAELRGAAYREVAIPGDSATAAQIDALWRHVTASINAGYGVVANIVAPVGNYPKAVAPSTTSPAYGPGKIFHYIAIMGYSDEHGQRAYWVADSGFSPFGYWCSATQMAHLIANKGYAYSTAAAQAAPSRPPVAPQAPAPVKTGPAFTIDISEWQNGLQLAKAKAEGIEAVILRTNDGTYRDKTFRSHLDDALANGLPVATYAYLRHPAEGTTIRQQVDTYEAVCPDRAYPVWLDAESPTAITADVVAQFKAEFERRGYRVLGVYTYRPYHAGAMRGADLSRFGRTWVAAYGTDPSADPATAYPGDQAASWAPLGGVVPSMWQFGSKVRVAGYGVDCNAIRDRALIPQMFHHPDHQEATVSNDYAIDTRAQLTGSKKLGDYPGFPSRRWLDKGEKNPSFTALDYGRELDREINSRFDYRKAPEAPIATLVGHVLATRRQLDRIEDKLDALTAN